MPLVEEEKWALIVIDMTKEQCEPLDKKSRKELIETIRSLSSHGAFRGRCFDCRLWLNNSFASQGSDGLDSTLSKVFPEVGAAGTEGANLIEELTDCSLDFVKKAQFSCFFGSQLESILKERQVTGLVLTGINTDYCVFATAIDAFYRGYRLVVCAQGVDTVSGDQAHREGLDRIRMHFGTSSVLEHFEVFTLLDDSAQLAK